MSVFDSPTPTLATAHTRCVRLRLVALSLIAAAAIMARLCIGQYFGWPEGTVVLNLRITAVVLSVIVGVALATSGVALQSLLRNPLAEPFILGLSSGAALGVMAQMLLESKQIMPPLPDHLGATFGALLSMSIVYLAGRRRGMIDPLHLLLTGVVLSVINGALIMVMDYMSGPGDLRANLFQWMMGHLNQNFSWNDAEVLVAGALTATGLLFIWRNGRAMDAATFSDAEAVSVGVNLVRLRVVLFAVASVLAATAVAIAGPISFVGLIAPHIARLLLGPRHGPLTLGAALIGAAMIVTASTASEAVDMHYNIGSLSIGVFTATLGGPLFLWMLRSQLVKTHQ